MTANNCDSYRKTASDWLMISIAGALVFTFLLILYSENSMIAIASIIGMVVSLVGLMVAWIFKLYYETLKKSLLEFEELPVLASWLVPHLNWGDYQLIEAEHRRKEYLKYILWSPVLIGFLSAAFWAESDDMPFDINLIWWGVGIYTIMMVVIYLQNKRFLNKTSKTDEHQIEIKTLGASIDGNITFWGKFSASSHDSFGKSIKAMLFAKTDQERRVNKTYIHSAGGLSYLVINFNLDENNQQELFLPLPNENLDEVMGIVGEINSSHISDLNIDEDSAKRYNSRKYLKWLIVIVTIASGLVWIIDQGIPIFHSWRANSYFDEGVDLYNNNQYPEALKKFQASLIENNQMPEAYLNIGNIYLNGEKLDSALYYYNKALELKPDFSLGLYNKGVVLYNQNQYRATVTQFQLYEKSLPENHDHDLIMGDVYYNLTLVDSAFMYYHRAYEENKKSSSLCYMLGVVMLDKGDLNQAVSYLEETIQLDSTFADGYLKLSEAYEKLGNIDLAQQNYDKNIQLLKNP